MSNPSQQVKDKARLAHILLTNYQKLYVAAHNRKPRLNRYSAKWGMVDVIDSIGFERAIPVLEYFFKTPGAHTIENFYKTFDALDANLETSERDRILREKILRETKLRIEGQH